MRRKIDRTPRGSYDNSRRILASAGSILLCLLLFGAKQDGLSKVVGQTRGSPAGTGPDFFSMIANDDSTSLKFWLDKRGLSPNAVAFTARNRKPTLLEFATTAGSLKCIKVLIAHHANVDHRDLRGFTPLMLASMGGSKEEVLALLDGGANPALKVNGITPYFGMTPLGLAIKFGKTENAALLRHAAKLREDKARKRPQ